jgi:hypothetical protein
MSAAGVVCGVITWPGPGALLEHVNASTMLLCRGLQADVDGYVGFLML